MKYASILSRVKKVIEKSDDKNWIIIGDNSVGKSELLRQIVIERRNDIYYIDSVNRGFNINGVNLTEDKINSIITSREIVDVRVEENIYNLRDSFGKNEHIERLYPLYKERLKELLKELINIDFSIEIEKFSNFN